MGVKHLNICKSLSLDFSVPPFSICEMFCSLGGTANSMPRLWAGSKGTQRFASSSSEKRWDAEMQLGQWGVCPP